MVYIDEGIYFIGGGDGGGGGGSWAFSSEDATARCPVTYTSYNNTKTLPIISGATSLPAPWIKMNDGLWLTKYDTHNGKFYPKQLWVNNNRAIRATLPSTTKNYMWANPLREGDAELNRWGFVYNKDDAPSSFDFHNIQDVDLLVYRSWVLHRTRIANWTSTNSTVMFSVPTDTTQVIGSSYDTNGASGHRYFIENVREGLDEQGEWYADRSNGTILYYPYDSDDISSSPGLISSSPYVLSLSGASYLTFKRLSFRHGDWECPPPPVLCCHQGASAQSLATIQVLASNYVNFTNIEIAHTGAHGIWVSSGSRHILIDSISTQDIGAGAVRIGNQDVADGTEYVTVNNSYIHDGGHVSKEGMGIFIQASSYNTIQYNEVAHFFYSGVSVGWTWGYATPSHAHDNMVRFNHIYDIGRGVLSDMGGIYTLGVSPNTFIHDNIVHNVNTYGYGGIGLYADEGSSGIEYYNNLVYETKDAGFNQNYGMDNYIDNNIFYGIGSYEGAISTSPNLEGGQNNSLNFNHNIVVITNATKLFGRYWETSDDNGRNFNQYAFDKNLYFSTKGNLTGPLFGPSLTWAAWRSNMNQDLHSLVDDDPLFVNAAAYDFNLQPLSPALRLSLIAPIDYTPVGPHGWAPPPPSRNNSDNEDIRTSSSSS
eukprot:TRINITY_DN2892_c0_g1_i4.p1 TRINITY_DN2892_c0_g1~~TRINITY_DN2892_c0_g1_i4.p1  ORF type:complete len:742 (+),score=141.30 TRINITY_DN2892_c0_g1_i4:273-2228(+)